MSGSDEFETIARLFRPLTRDAPEAAELLDDAAFLPPRRGVELVVTTDAVVEGVHFLPGDAPDLVARKLLRMNLSDLAAKAAEPYGYLLTVAWPPAWDAAGRAGFAAGLAEDQETFGLVLFGGDTVSTPGPLTASITMIGLAPEGRAVRRSGARPGDGVFVTGTIGDGVLGLQAASGGLLGVAEGERAFLAGRYRLPQPRVDFRNALLDQASACADVSDGLVADLGHVARASGVGAWIELEKIPLSAAARAWLELQPERTPALLELITGGDDYELVFTAASAVEGAVRIGEVVPGQGVRVIADGGEIPIGRAGWRHG